MNERKKRRFFCIFKEKYKRKVENERNSYKQINMGETTVYNEKKHNLTSQRLFNK